jgi:hypothetical protein
MELANSRGVITRLCDAACALAIGTTAEIFVCCHRFPLEGLRYACFVSNSPKSVPRKNVPAGAEAGLCSDCRHARAILSDRGSVFVMCQLSSVDPAFPKYPRLPVVSCPGYSRNAEPPRSPAT